MSTLTHALTGLARGARRLLLPEALLLALLLWLPTRESFGFLAPYAGLLAATTAMATVGVGWRFRNGRVTFGAVALLAAGVLPMLPPGPAPVLGGLIMPWTLVLLAVLPDRGVVTVGGALRAVLLSVELALLILLALAQPAPLAVPPSLPLPWPGPVDGVLGSLDLVLAGTVSAALLLGVRALRGGPVHRGFLWGTVALVAPHLGAPGVAGWHALTAVLMLLSAALEDAHRLAYHDALTGLPSRRALDELLARLRGRYTVAMVDVDHFKQFNDRYGHDVGDEVLRMVAARIRSTPGAQAYRYGGEEFTLVFRGRSLKQVRRRLEEVRRRIGDAEFVIRGPERPDERPERKLFLWRPRQSLGVTASVGAAERVARRQTPEAVLAEADRALYRAKQRGRNRVVTSKRGVA